MMTKDKVFVDANIIIYANEAESKLHIISSEHFKYLSNGIGVINPYVINEVHYYFLKNYGYIEAGRVVKQLLDLNFTLKDIIFTTDDINKIIDVSIKYNLSTFDSFHSYFCKKLEIKKIATFDKDFRKIPWLKIYK